MDGAEKLKPVDEGAAGCCAGWAPNAGNDALWEKIELLSPPACCPKVKPLEGCWVFAELVIPHEGAGKLCAKGEFWASGGRAAGGGRRPPRGLAILMRTWSGTLRFIKLIAYTLCMVEVKLE